MDHAQLSNELVAAVAHAATVEVVEARAEDMEFKPNVEQLLAGGLLQWGEMTHAEREGKRRMTDTMRKRKQRSAAERERERAAKEITPPDDPERMRAAMGIVGTLFPLITKLVTAKYNKVRRVLGDTEREDIASICVERMANALANSKFELFDLAEAALWLAEQPGIPNLPKRKSDEVPFACKAIMGRLGRVTTNAIVDTYRAHPNDVSLEYLATMSEVARTVDDAVTERMVARSKPHFGPRAPGRPEARDFAACVIDVAIRARGLTWLSDLIESNLRTDGLMQWTVNADTILERLDLGVLTVIESKTIKAEAAREATRTAFEYLPDVVRKAHEIVDDPALMYDLAHSPKTVWQPAMARTLDEHLPMTEYDHIELVAGLDPFMRDLYNGKRFFLEGQAEGTAPVQLHEGPGPDEWKKIRKVTDSTYSCPHGQRKLIFGTNKKAHKWPRPWSGHFCPEKGDHACEPFFGKPPTPVEQAVEAIGHVTDSTLVETY